MATDAQFTDLYRQSSIGLALVDAIDDLVTVTQRLEPQLAIKILRRFDRAMSEALQRKVRDRLRFQGSLDTYRFCDEVWTFLVRDVTLKLVDGEGVVQAGRVKIIACALENDDASPSQTERKKRKR